MFQGDNFKASKSATTLKKKANERWVKGKVPAGSYMSPRLSKQI